MKLIVKGRGKLRASTVTDWYGVFIRLDDDKEGNEEFWAEVRISLADLKTLIKESEGALLRQTCTCKSDGPPGPIWCRKCGHDPKCCSCRD